MNEEMIGLGSDKLISASLNECAKMVELEINKKKRGIAEAFPFARTNRFWFVSPPGVGKSSMFSDQLPKRLGIPFRFIDCPHLSEGDLSGLPYPEKDQDGNITGIKKFKYKAFFPMNPTADCPLTWEDLCNLRSKDVNVKNAAKEKYLKHIKECQNHPVYGEYFRPGYIFLDELANQLFPSIRNELLSFTDGTFKGEHNWPMLPPTWLVIAAGNREQDIQDYQAFGANVEQRFMFVKLVPKFEEFEQYMNSYSEGNTIGFHPLIQGFLHEKPNLLLREVQEGEKTALNPRSWEDANSVLRSYDTEIEIDPQNKTMLRNILAKNLQSRLGMEVALEFIHYIDSKEEYIPTDLLLNTRLDNKKLQEKPKDIVYISLYNAVDKLDVVDTSKKDKEDGKKESSAKLEKARKERYINLLENAYFLFFGSGTIMEQMSAFAVAVLTRENQPISNVSDLSPQVQKSIQDSLLFLKDILKS